MSQNKQRISFKSNVQGCFTVLGEESLSSVSRYAGGALRSKVKEMSLLSTFVVCQSKPGPHDVA